MSLVHSHRVPEETILAVPEPQWTDTWHPISHARCLNVLTTAVNQFHLEVSRKEYSLSEDGFRCFGSWVIGSGSNIINTTVEREISQTLVFRNSLNKAFAFGIAAGTHAWVCSNMAFNGEFIEFRRHTKGMDDGELERVVSNGMEIILPRMKKFQEWHQGLHEVKIIPSKMRELAYNAIVQDVIPRRQIDEFDKLLFSEEHSYINRELFGFHGACTQLYRDKSMVNTDGRQKALFDFIQEWYGKFLPSLN